MFRTCCWPAPQTSFTSWKSCSIVARSAKASIISTTVTFGSVEKKGNQSCSSLTITTRITPPHGLVGGQKGLVGLGNRFSVSRTLDRLPALPMSRAFGQADPVLPVRAGTPPSPSLAAPQRTRQVAQGCVLAESANRRSRRWQWPASRRAALVYPPSTTTHNVFPACFTSDAIHSTKWAASSSLVRNSPAALPGEWWESSSLARTAWPAAAGPAGPTTDAAAPATA